GEVFQRGRWSAVSEERRSVGRGGRLIAVAPRLAGELTRWYGADPERIATIPNGATFAPPTEARAPLRARYGVPEAVPVLLTGGRDDYVKGYDFLARAWGPRRRAGPHGGWVAVGGPPAGPRPRRARARPGVARRGRELDPRGRCGCRPVVLRGLRRGVARNARGRALRAVARRWHRA